MDDYSAGQQHSSNYNMNILVSLFLNYVIRWQLLLLFHQKLLSYLNNKIFISNHLQYTIDALLSILCQLRQ